MKVDNWKKILKENFYKEYEVESEPENFIHEGLDANQFYSHLEEFIGSLIQKQKKVKEQAYNAGLVDGVRQERNSQKKEK